MVEGEGRLPQQLRGPSSTDHERIESREPSLSLDPLQYETAEMTFGQIPDELSAAELRVMAEAERGNLINLSDCLTAVRPASFQSINRED
jgi:hypothetical protein